MWTRRVVPWLLAVGFVACEGRLLTISVGDTSSTTIAKGTLLEELAGDFGFGEFVGMDITASEELANQGVQPGDISEVYFTDLTLTAASPSQADLSFIESIDVFVEAPDLPRVKVASGVSFPEGQAEVSLDLMDEDLVDYVVSQSMTVSTEASGRRPDADTKVEIRFALDVGVTGQGACNYIKGGSDE